LASFPGPKITWLAATRHADIDFEHLLSRQPAHALPDLRKAILARLIRIESPSFEHVNWMSRLL
jgi:hypothetical protein